MNVTKPWWVPDIRAALSIILVLDLSALMFVLIFHPVNDLNDLTKVVIGGFMTVGFAGVVSFWFGTSKSSADKDATVNQIAMMPGPGDIPPNPPAAQPDKGAGQ